jgi:hypothetical protein
MLHTPYLSTNLNKIGVKGAVTPQLGGPSTSFHFAIVYTFADTPTAANVYIDGTPHAMTNMGTSGTDGTLYEYISKLPVGPHHVQFTFTDASGTSRVPFNNEFMNAPYVYPYTVTPGIKPTIALVGQAVTFSAKYMSPSNTAPILEAVDIDGSPHALTSTGGTNYQTGVTYAYTISSLAIGTHYVRYRFDNGSGAGPAVYEDYVMSVTPLNLTNASASLVSGTTNQYTYQVTYTEVNGETPSQAYLYVDKLAPVTMTLVSGSNTTGAVYNTTLTLSAGNHSWYIVFADSHSQTSWPDPVGPSVFAGPNVAAGAQAVPPGTLITPSEDVNPNGPLDENN